MRTLFSCLLLVVLGALAGYGQEATKRPELNVLPCDDFEVNGSGDNAAWQKADWVPMAVRAKSAHDYRTRFKMLYSKSGLYVLFDGDDKRITASKSADYLDLWTEDVFECFFWTDERHPIYFEYEISPLGYELPILIPNIDGKFLGWQPWHIGKPDKQRVTRRAVVGRGAPITPGAALNGWSAEVFIPYAMLTPLAQVPPRPGTKWRGNFYRMDYDEGKQGSWHWAPVGNSFHEYQSFGDITFK